MQYLDLPKPDQAKLLAELIAMPGWRLFAEMIDQAEIQKCLAMLEAGQHKNLGEVEFLQHKIKFARAMLELPTIFLESIKDEMMEEQKENKGVDEDDPYFNTVKEVDEANQKDIDGVYEEDLSQ